MKIEQAVILCLRAQLEIAESALRRIMNGDCHEGAEAMVAESALSDLVDERCEFFTDDDWGQQ